MLSQLHSTVTKQWSPSSGYKYADKVPPVQPGHDVDLNYPCNECNTAESQREDQRLPPGTQCKGTLSLSVLMDPNDTRPQLLSHYPYGCDRDPILRDSMRRYTTSQCSNGLHVTLPSCPMGPTQSRLVLDYQMGHTLWYPMSLFHDRSDYPTKISEQRLTWL